MARIDPHSYTDPVQGVIEFMSLKLTIDFKGQRLRGEAILQLDRPSSGVLHLDTRDLEIHKVTSPSRGRVSYSLDKPDPILGSRLEIRPPKGTRLLHISYGASRASALQWLRPEQTSGGMYPFLFSQCQPIHARSIIPTQDSPRVRFRYDAQITVPKPLVAVIAAGFVACMESPIDSGLRQFEYRMSQPIPAYLFAFAVGNIQGKDVGPRSRVWAEPKMLDASAREFSEIEEMIKAGEKIFGAYRWDRYDMLMMPPSFPFAGMENPRLSFFTPAIVVGDRSEIFVLLHELSHAWTGNLATNATMNDFWLNEGLTTWGERRILEVIMGQEFTTLECAIGRKKLEEEMERLGWDSPFTKLKTNLEGIDPDEALSCVPYEKGFLFAALLEQTSGRSRFDEFMRAYMNHFAFRSLTSEDFLAFLDEKLPGLSKEVDAHAWVYEPGLPANTPSFHSEKLENIEALASGWKFGRRPGSFEQKQWGAAELKIFLRNIPHELPRDDCKLLDSIFGLNEHRNPVVRSLWFRKAAVSGYEPAFVKMREFLGSLGIFFAIKHVYQALSKNEETRELARTWHKECRKGYHPITRRVVENCLGKK